MSMKVFEICGESYVLADDAKAEIEKLKAENERLKAAQECTPCKHKFHPMNDAGELSCVYCRETIWEQTK